MCASVSAGGFGTAWRWRLVIAHTHTAHNRKLFFVLFWIARGFRFYFISLFYADNINIELCGVCGTTLSPPPNHPNQSKQKHGTAILRFSIFCCFVDGTQHIHSQAILDARKKLSWVLSNGFSGLPFVYFFVTFAPLVAIFVFTATDIDRLDASLIPAACIESGLGTNLFQTEPFDVARTRTHHCGRAQKYNSQNAVRNSSWKSVGFSLHPPISFFRWRTSMASTHT